MNANQALGASKVYTNMVALGLSDISINEATGTVTFGLTDGSSASWTFPVPQNGADGEDGVSVTDADIDASNHLILTLSDESTIDCGALPTSGGSGSGGVIGQGSLATMSGNVIPSAPSAYSLGSESRKLKAVYADEVFISKNTLYIDGTPVFSKNNTNDILVSADENQSVKVATKGVATTGIMSEGAVEIATTKEASNVNIKSGDVSTGNSSNVNVSASNNINEIANNQITLKAPNIKLEGSASVVGGLNVDSLNVSGNVTVSGESFIVEAESVEVKDNIMVLNKGEVGTGVTKGTSGIKIDRGDAPDYELVFDESDDMFKIGEIGDLETVATQEYVGTQLEGYVDKSNIDSYLTEYAKKSDIPSGSGTFAKAAPILLADLTAKGSPVEVDLSDALSNYSELNVVVTVNESLVYSTSSLPVKDFAKSGGLIRSYYGGSFGTEVKYVNDTKVTIEGYGSATINTKIYGVKSINCYSTAEQADGTWVDGKTRYRKTFIQNGLDEINLSGLNIDTLIAIEGGFAKPSGGFIGVNACMGSNYATCAYLEETKKLTFICGGSWTVYSCPRLTLTYTKTTD